MVILLALLACMPEDQVLAHYDRDGDGFLHPEAEAQGVDGPFDCDDANADIHPDAAEVCDGVDNDCDEAVDDGDAAPESFYVDADGDGHGEPSKTQTACEQPDGTALVGDDCDDAVGTAFPGAAEIPYDDVDQDCSGGDLTDVDSDGHDAEAAGGDDCDDENTGAFPGAAEGWLDYGVDNDCDGDAFGAVTWDAGEAVTRLDGVAAGGEAGRRIGFWDAGNCLFIAAPYEDSARGIVYAEPGGAAGIRDVGGNGVISTTVDASYLSGDLVSNEAGRTFVSAPSRDSGGGRAWLVDGEAACSGADLVVDEDATLTLTGEPATYFGSFARFLEDIDGDGVEELVVGAPSESTGGTYAGAVYVWYEPPADGSVVAAADADVIVYGSEASGAMYSVTEAWDDAGPGVPYLLFTQAVDTAGDVGVLRVTPSNLATGSVLDVADGGVATWATGRAMTAVVTSDMDFDGSDTVLAGAWTMGLWDVDELDGVVYDEDATFKLTDTAESWFTPGHIGLGDYDGDTRGDFLMMAEDWPSGGERGRMSFFLSSDRDSGGTWAFESSPLQAIGASDDQSFGYRAVDVGDFDADGRRDIAVSAYGTSFHGVSSGSVFLLPSPFGL